MSKGIWASIGFLVLAKVRLIIGLVEQIQQ